MVRRYLIGLAVAFALFVTVFSNTVLITASETRASVPGVVAVGSVARAAISQTANRKSYFAILARIVAVFVSFSAPTVRVTV